MTTVPAERVLTDEQLRQWEEDGFLIIKGLFTDEEVKAAYEFFRAKGEQAEAFPGWAPDLSEEGMTDPLKRYPRMMHPYREYQLAEDMLLDPRVGAVMRDLLGEVPIAAQSMFYFKPKGARGQALHQDNFYLEVAPETCIAAWTALEKCDEDNGCLVVAPGTHREDIHCPTLADNTESFSPHLVQPPEGTSLVNMEMEPGDVLFFNGSVIHGSKPNNSQAGRNRYSFICHYMPQISKQISRFYYPLLNFDGEQVEREMVDEGGFCGEEVRKWSSEGKWM